MTQLLFTVLLIAICPLMMFLMMRGMMGGGRVSAPVQNPAPPLLGSSSQDVRIAELEREVARLTTTRPADGGADLIATGPGQREFDGASTVSAR